MGQPSAQNVDLYVTQLTLAPSFCLIYKQISGLLKPLKTVQYLTVPKEGNFREYGLLFLR